ncbi:MAG: alanine racemase [Candidatus Latescibacterota bacterium]
MEKLPTWLEIDLDKLAANITWLRSQLNEGVKILHTIKADAYGHGAVQVARASHKLVDMFGVATVDEGLELKGAGIDTPILILSPVLAKEIPQVVAAGFAITLSSTSFAKRLSDRASDNARTIDFHIEVDTGMGRTGLYQEEAREVIVATQSLPGIRFAGLYTHFAASDTDPSFTRKQIESFLAFNEDMRSAGVTIPCIHSANSGAISTMPSSQMEMVRPGLIFFGYLPSADLSVPQIKPIMSWKSRLVQVRDVPEGRTISYGRTFTTKRKTRMGIVPVGYGHGYPFRLSNKGMMIVKGELAPILGRVTMDLTMVDLTDHSSNPVAGDEVVLIGGQKKVSISLHEIAEWSDALPYEILCGISKRVPRTYFKNGKVETYKSLLGILPSHVIE